MHGDHGFTWYSLIPGLDHAPQHVIGTILIALLLIGVTFLARLKLMQASRKADGALVPPPKWSFLNFFDVVAENLYKMTVNVIGDHDAPKFFPVIGSLFLFIFSCNLLGLIPGFLPPTDNLNVTLGLGIFVFLYYNYVGLKANGMAYLKHFLGPILWLAPLMLVIELASHVFRPLSLGLRLRGNIMGDHVVLGIFSDLVPFLLPVVFYGIGVFVAFVQAFVFCLLTMVYISLSTAHDH